MTSHPDEGAYDGDIYDGEPDPAPRSVDGTQDDLEDNEEA